MTVRFLPGGPLPPEITTRGGSGDRHRTGEPDRARSSRPPPPSRIRPGRVAPRRPGRRRGTRGSDGQACIKTRCGGERKQPIALSPRLAAGVSGLIDRHNLDGRRGLAFWLGSVIVVCLVVLDAIPLNWAARLSASTPRTAGW